MQPLHRCADRFRKILNNAHVRMFRPFRSHDSNSESDRPIRVTECMCRFSLKCSKNKRETFSTFFFLMITDCIILEWEIPFEIVSSERTKRSLRINIITYDIIILSSIYIYIHNALLLIYVQYIAACRLSTWYSWQNYLCLNIGRIRGPILRGLSLHAGPCTCWRY